MSPLQISHSPDLLQLREQGYNIAVVDGYLVVRDVPYVNSQRHVCRGILVSKLDLAGDRTGEPTDHTIMFAGEFPCSSDGTPIDLLRHRSVTTELSDGLTVHHSFSRKPPSGRYSDYREKIETYIGLISREVTLIDPTVSPLTFQVVEPDDADYPFNYFDTASARAEINMISKKLAGEKIGIVGLGGTGSYVLDLIAKTPVREIHLFDSDKLSTHNAFRSPGTPSVTELREQPYKTSYFQQCYAKMHRRITSHEFDIAATNVDVLREMTFVFLCVDRGTDRKFITGKLEEFDIPFVDVGIGLYRHGDFLGGQVRVSTSLPGRREAARESMPITAVDQDNEYDKDIQVADLNALNACLAVIKWKKFCGFYLDSERELLTTYTIGFNLLASDHVLCDTVEEQ